MKKIIMAAVVIILLTVLGLKVYISHNTPEKSDIRGSITNISKADSKDVEGWILVEGAIEKDTGFDKASITVTNKTKIFQLDNNGVKSKVSFGSLKMDQKVEVQFTGPVRESYPVQADALEIRILE